MTRAAQVHVLVAGFGPHVDIADVDIGAGRLVRTHDLYGAALSAVGLGAAPVLSRDVGERHAVAGDGAHGAPVLVNVKSVRVAVANEVLKQDVFNVSGAAVGLDHHHLVGLPGVDVAVFDLGDGCVGAERTHAATAGPVAVNVLDKQVGGRGLDGYALVLVGDHDLNTR